MSDGHFSDYATALAGNEGVTGWSKVLERWVGQDADARDLAAEAGRTAPSRLRPGVEIIYSDWSVLRILGAVDITGVPWAVSGWPAAVAPEAAYTGMPFQLYVDGGARNLGLALPSSERGALEVHVLPFDGISEQGALAESGVHYAHPHQVLIDLYSNPATEELGDHYYELLGGSDE